MNIWPEESYRIFPLSRNQRGIWEMELLNQNSPMNSLCTSLLIKGRMDIGLAARGINRVLEQDVSLRTRLAVIGGAPYQYQVAFKEEAFPFFDFSAAGAEGISRWETVTAQTAMPVTENPLYRFYIYKSGEESGGILIRVHRLIADGWRIADLAERFAAVYFALLSGKRPDLSETPGYERYISSERGYLDSDAFRTDRAFWAEQIEAYSGERAFLKKTNHVSVSGAGEHKSFGFSGRISHGIEMFCAKNRVAPFVVYGMALAIHLKRMSGRGRMCFGVPAVDRQEFADKTAGGMAVGTLPLFFKTDTALSADELALDLAGRWEDLLRHRRLPFSEIAALANCSENPGERLFHIALSCQEGKIFRDGGTAVTFSGKWLYSGYQIEHLLILLSRSAGENQYTADYQYLPCLYASEDIEDLHRHITKILSEILSHPRIPVRQLDLLSDGEFERVVYTFNKTAGGIPLPSVAEESLRPSVAENFLRAAEKTPDKTALICDDHQITFTGLYERVLLIAARIREQITGQIAPSGNISATETGGEHTVALCLPRGADLVAAMLAACFAGGGWMILPPALPELRLRQMMVDSGAALLVTVPENLPLFDGYTGPVLLIGTVFEAVETGGLPVRSDGGDLAYVAYTSGRTGTPKGVMIEQRSLTNFARSMDAVYAGGGSVLALNSTGFDVFILESVAALLCGRTVVMAKEEQCGDPAALAGLIKKYAVSFFAMTPSRLEAYITNPGFADALGNMESIVCGGEPFCDGLLRRLERLTKARIYNQYGPAETAIGVSYKCLDEGCPLSAGKPMANCRLYVLDEDGNPLPAEAAGELYIGGACVGRGYLKDGEATRKSFLSDMFVAGQRMYRTGDSAKWDKNGEIHLLGRCGEQPEPPGCRAEAHETAALLRTYPRIRQAAVRIIKKGNGGYIAAYYTGPEEIPADRLFAYCGARLPAYMVPHHFEHLQEMPLTISGKTDTGRLPDPLPPAAGEIAVDTTPAAAGKTTLDLLLGIFSRNLEREDLTPDSRYFQSGGNSLGALTVLAEIGSQTGVELSYTELCRLDTPAKIAEAIEKIQRGEPEPPQRENDLPPAPRNPPDMPKAAPQVDLPIDIIADCNAFAAPDADAILWRGRRISFDEFRRRSDSAAARLTETGVRHGDVVGVYCDRTPDLIYAVFGVLKCGAAYLPLTYQLPVERISRVLSLAGAKTVIGDREISGLDPGVFSQCRIPDELMPFRTDVGRSTADIAQFLFVPGEPAKSVSISHRTLGGLLPGLISLWNAAGIAGSVLCTADFLSDAFTAEGLLPLAAKLPVALADGDENMRADGLLEFLGRQDP